MKCPNCECACSDLRDICPQCLVDLRPHKQSLGIPATYPTLSYAELINKFGTIKAGTEQKSTSLFGGLFKSKPKETSTPHVAEKPFSRPSQPEQQKNTKTVSHDLLNMSFDAPVAPRAVRESAPKPISLDFDFDLPTQEVAVNPQTTSSEPLIVSEPATSDTALEPAQTQLSSGDLETDPALSHASEMTSTEQPPDSAAVAADDPVLALLSPESRQRLITRDLSRPLPSDSKSISLITTPKVDLSLDQLLSTFHALTTSKPEETATTEPEPMPEPITAESEVALEIQPSTANSVSSETEAPDLDSGHHFVDSHKAAYEPPLAEQSSPEQLNSIIELDSSTEGSTLILELSPLVSEIAEIGSEELVSGDNSETLEYQNLAPLDTDFLPGRKGFDLKTIDRLFDEAKEEINNETLPEEFSIPLHTAHLEGKTDYLELLFDLAQEGLANPDTQPEYVEEVSISSTKKLISPSIEAQVASFEQALNHDTSLASTSTLYTASSSAATNALDKARKETPLVSRLVRPTLRRRFLAAIIDLVVTLVIAVLVSAAYIHFTSEFRSGILDEIKSQSWVSILGLLHVFICVFMATLYLLPFISYLLCRCTPGTKYTSLRLIDADRYPASVKAVLWRSIMSPLSLVTGGWLPALFGKRPLHETLSGAELSAIATTTTLAKLQNTK